MELKTLQKELHRLDQLVGAWRDAADITTLERDLVLARLRDIYEAVLFGLEATAPEEVAPQAVAVAAPVVEMPEAEAETIEEPLVFEGDDFFSLDAILPVEEEFAPMEEMPTEEVAPVEEEVASEVVEEPIAEPAAEEPMAFEEEVEEIAPVVEEIAPVVEGGVEEVAPAVEETPVVEEQTEEVAPVVEEVAPVVEEPKVEPTPAREKKTPRERRVRPVCGSRCRGQYWSRYRFEKVRDFDDFMRITAGKDAICILKQE